MPALRWTRPRRWWPAAAPIWWPSAASMCRIPTWCGALRWMVRMPSRTPIPFTAARKRAIPTTPRCRDGRSGRDAEQLQPQPLDAGRDVDGDGLRLQHVLVQRALALDREIIGVGPHRHFGRHLRHVYQFDAGQRQADDALDVVGRGDL